VQRDAFPNAGFSAAEPWLPLADDFRTVNVVAQRDDLGSMLSLYRRLIALRRAEPALAVGSYAPIEASGDVLAYVRTAGASNRRFLIALNLGPTPHTLDLPGTELAGRVVLGTHPDRDGDPVRDALALRGAEGVVVEIVDSDHPG
jgi:alpha-glucosidase